MLHYLNDYLVFITHFLFIHKVGNYEDNSWNTPFAISTSYLISIIRETITTLSTLEIFFFFWRRVFLFLFLFLFFWGGGGWGGV